MTNPDDGTLQGLIADLKARHTKEQAYYAPRTPGNDTDQPILRPGVFYCSGPDEYCQEYGPYWPCPVSEIIEKHERAMYFEDNEDNGQVSVWWNEDIRPNIDFDEPLFIGSPREAKAWIDKQVAG